MADEAIQKLVALVEARTASAEKQMERWARTSESRLARVEATAAKAASRMEASMTKAFRGMSTAAAALGSGLAIRQIISYADAWTNAGNKLAAIGVPAGEVRDRLEEIYQIANRSRAGLSETVSLYQRLSQASQSLGITQAEVARVTETVQKALAVGGATASEAAAATRQFAQALGSGVLRGDEFNSIMENAPQIAQAIAQEFGVTTDKLRKMAEAGELTADRIVKALLNASAGIEEAFARTEGTVGQSLDRLGNAMMRFVGELNEAVPIIDLLAGALEGTAWAVDQVADAVAAGPFGAFIEEAKQAERVSFNLRMQLVALAGVLGTIAAVGAVAKSGTVNKNPLAKAPDGKGLLNKDGSYVLPVVLNDLPTSIDDEIFGKPRAELPDIGDLNRVRKAAKDAAEALAELTAERRNWRNDPEAKYDARQSLEDISSRQSDIVGKQLEPMIVDAEAAAALREGFRRAFRYAFQQMTEGDFAGAAATFAGAFADRLNDRISDQLFDFVWDSLGLGDVAGQLFGPLDAAQAAQAATTTQATAAINLMANAAYNAASALASVAGGGGGGGGFLGAITSALGSVFGGVGPIKGVGGGIGGGFRANGGPVSKGVPYIVGEKRPELFVPNTSGYIMPKVPQAVSRGGASYVFNPVINAPGADPAAVSRLEAMMQRSQSDFRNWAAAEKARVRAHVGDLHSRRAL